jgi:hypothetical protein
LLKNKIHNTLPMPSNWPGVNFKNEIAKK